MKDMIGRTYFINGRQVHPDEYFTKPAKKKAMTRPLDRYTLEQAAENVVAAIEQEMCKAGIVDSLLISQVSGAAQSAIRALAATLPKRP